MQGHFGRVSGNRTPGIALYHQHPNFFFKIFLKINLFYFYLFLAVLGLHCCTRAFSSYSERGLLFVVVCRLHCGGFSCCGARALGVRASVVVARGLSSCGSWALERRLSSCGARA